MNSIKAIVAGTVFILVVNLIIQLAFIFVAVGFHRLADSFPFLNEISGWFRYLIGIPVVLVVAFVGGYITAAIAKTRVFLHCFIVGVITVVAMMWSLLSASRITPFGVVVMSLLLAAVVVGGFYQQKREKS